MSEGLRVIAAAIMAGSMAPVAEMGPEMFEPAEQTVANFVRQHYRQYRQMPSARTIQEETGVRLPQAPEALEYYVDRMYERHQYNGFRNHFGSLREAIASRNMTSAADAVRAMHTLSRQTRRQGQELMNIREAAQLVQTRLEETRGYGGITGIEVDWPRYDRITGGYQRADLVSIVGRMGLGKTYVLLRQAVAAHAAGANVLVVTTEMSTEQIGRRHVALALGINPEMLRLNYISTYQRRRIASFYNDMIGAERLNIFSVGMKSRTQALEALMQEYMPDLVMIDGVHLLRPTEARGNMSRTERITAVLDEVKGLTLETQRPIIVTSHFNRVAGKGGKDGSLETISYSDAFGTHSSLVVALRPGPSEFGKNARILEFMKGREGEEGQVAINFKFAPTDMSELDWVPGQEETTDGTPQDGANSVNWMAT